MRLLIYMILVPLLGLAQPYIKASFDPNQAFLIIDNPRQKQDVRGLDWDLEAGVKEGRFGVYVFAGAFQEIDYQNYGYGVDFYPITSKGHSFSFYWPWNGQRVSIDYDIESYFGIGHGFLLRKFDDDWGGLLAWHARAGMILWFNNIGFGGRLQYQQRPLNSSFGIIEGHLEVKLRFDVREKTP